MNYEMSERDSDWNGPMSDPNTGGTLEQIQKERRGTLLKIAHDNSHISPGEATALFVAFHNESIRIAYEAGAAQHPLWNPPHSSP